MAFVRNEITTLPPICKNLRTDDLVRLCFILSGNLRFVETNAYNLVTVLLGYVSSLQSFTLFESEVPQPVKDLAWKFIRVAAQMPLKRGLVEFYKACD